VVVLLGIIGANTYMQLRGARYRAEASVLLTTEELANVITDTQPVFVDPQRVEETGVALARSPELYVRTAKRNGGALGTGEELEDLTKVSAHNDILTFAVTKDDGEQSIRIANAVSAEYRRWRKDLQGDRIHRALAEVRRQLADEPVRSARKTELRGRVNDLELLASLNTGNTVPVEEATTAARVSPAPVRDSLIGAGVGLFLAFLVIGAREAIDTKVRSEEDVEDLLGAPVLARVHRLPRRTRLVMFGRHENEFADVYALLAANILQSKTSGPLSLAITSSVAQEGKTTTAANLAVALARRGRRVVIADFDTRKPALGELFRLPRDAPGITQVLRGNAKLEDTKWTVSLNGRGPIPRHDPEGEAVADSDGGGSGSLQIIPAGGALQPSSTTELSALKGILRELKRGTDVLLCDTPPALLTVETTELTQNVDRVVVVVRHGRVTRRALRTLSRHVHGWHAELLGAVMTDAPVEERLSYYYGSR
jgi:tyrosine-protein kinase